jgi:phenylalanyl-tRNA synthetase beta chain
VAAAFDLEGDIYCGELFTAPLLAAATESVYSPVGRFPNVKVDVAAVVDEAVDAIEVERVIRQSGGDTLKSVRLFDVYRGPQVAQGKKSLAYALEFGSPSGTLTDEQAHRRLDAVIAALQKELLASIRGREREGEAR